MPIAFVPSAAFWTGIAGIVVAGVVGPAVGYWAAARADRRRFRHERGLKASDDLQARIDDVAAGLEELGEACAQLRGRVTLRALDSGHFGGPLHEQVGSTLVAAGDAYQVVRAQIARLGMRPHAPAETVTRAKAAADCFFEAIQSVQNAIIRDSMLASNATDEARDRFDPQKAVALADLPVKVENGYELTREFEAAARDALERLLGSPPE